jgi:hypothetical protein
VLFWHFGALGGLLGTPNSRGDCYDRRLRRP